jgi:hypothetical protein
MRACLFDPHAHDLKATTNNECKSSASRNERGRVTAVDTERIHSDPLSKALDARSLGIGEVCIMGAMSSTKA